MGLIRRTLSICSPKVIKLLYRGLVGPKLEGGLSLAPHFKKGIKVLKDVQKRAAKVISGMQELSYPARLAKL